MPEPQIRFDDGAGYERMMGIWSQLAGEVFLDWLAPAAGLRWVDVGCGTGAFTELLCRRCAPAAVHGVDPSEAQLGFARTRPLPGTVDFRRGDAMALPFADNSFDAAVMALVIFFVPEPSRGVAEMARVAGPGGIVAAYGWDQTTGGSPVAPIQSEMRAMGYRPPRPPSSEASSSQALAALWADAGLEAVDSREITVTRSFADFDHFWAANLTNPTLAAGLSVMTADEVERLRERIRAKLPPDATGRVGCRAHANAIKGRVPR